MRVRVLRHQQSWVRALLLPTLGWNRFLFIPAWWSCCSGSAVYPEIPASSIATVNTWLGEWAPSLLAGPLSGDSNRIEPCVMWTGASFRSDAMQRQRPRRVALASVDHVLVCHTQSLSCTQLGRRVHYFFKAGSEVICWLCSLWLVFVIMFLPVCPHSMGCGPRRQEPRVP